MDIDPKIRLLFNRTQLLLELPASLYAAVRDDNYYKAINCVAIVGQVNNTLPDLITTLREQNND